MNVKTTKRVFRRAALAAALALPVGALTPGTPASAHVSTGPDISTWDALAQCESGGDWHADTGNGYYGGLQFSDETWDSFGGERFGGEADEAAKREQIRIAEKVLHAQGWKAWPGCSSKLGLR